MFWDLLPVWLGIVALLLLLTPWLRSVHRVVRVPAGAVLVVAAVALLFWGVRTFLVYVLGVGDEYRDSGPAMYVAFVLFCLLAGAFTAVGARNLLRGGRPRGSRARRIRHG